jgi:hypothetical protein
VVQEAKPPCRDVLLNGSKKKNESINMRKEEDLYAGWLAGTPGRYSRS